MLVNDICEQNQKILKDTDVILASYPRSGNTWMRLLLSDIILQSQGFKTQVGGNFIPDIYKEGLDIWNRDPRIKQVPLRIIKSHEFYDARYINTIYLFRKPADALCSFYYYLLRYPGQEELQKQGIDDFCKVRVEQWRTHVESYIEAKEKKSDKVLFISYESLKEKPEIILRKTTRDFLGLNITSRMCQIAVENQDFEGLQRIQKLEDTSQLGFWEAGGYQDFFRKGKVNSSKDELAQSTIDFIEATAMAIYNLALSIEKLDFQKESNQGMAMIKDKIEDLVSLGKQSSLAVRLNGVLSNKNEGAVSQVQIHHQKESELYKLQLHSTQAELAQSQSQLQQIQGEAQQYQSQLHQTQEVLEQFQDQMQQAEKLLQEYQAQLHSTQAELEQSQSQLHSTQAELEQSQSQLHSTEAVLEQYQSQLHSTEVVLEQYQSQLHSTEVVLEQSQSQMHQNRAELAHKNSQLHQSEWELERSRFQLHQTQAELAQSQAELAECNSKVEPIQLEVERVGFQIGQVQGELEHSQSKLRSSSMELKRSHSQLVQVLGELEHSQAQQRQTEAILQQSQSQKHQFQNELKRFYSQLAQVQEESQDYQSQLVQVQEESQDYQSQLVQVQEESQHYQSQLVQVQEELARSHFQQQYAVSDRGVESQMPYTLLVRDAWYAYQSGDLKKMQLCLQESLKITPISRTESVVNWLESFCQFSAEKGQPFDTYSLTNSQEWKRLMQGRFTVT